MRPHWLLGGKRRVASLAILALDWKENDGLPNGEDWLVGGVCPDVVEFVAAVAQHGSCLDDPRVDLLYELYLEDCCRYYFVFVDFHDVYLSVLLRLPMPRTSYTKDTLLRLDSSDVSSQRDAEGARETSENPDKKPQHTQGQSPECPID